MARHRFRGVAPLVILPIALACSSGGGGGGFYDGGAAASGMGGAGGGQAGAGGGTAGAGAVGGSGGSSGVGGVAGTGGTPFCKTGGDSCQAFNECCSGVCAQQVCTGCTPIGGPCGSAVECCVGLLCMGGQCSACVDVGLGCTLSSDCCSNICSQGACAPCKSNGTACTGPTECCSGQCNAGSCGTTTGSGACTNPSDQAVKSSYDLEQESYNCATSQCTGTPSAACVAGCLSSATGLSPGCASCYGGGVECVFQNCLSQCLAGIDSEPCMTCGSQFCAAPFTQCSGWATP